MIKKCFICALLFIQPLLVSNGYYQATKIEFEDMEGPCYGTLLSRYSESGPYSSKKEMSYDAPKEVIEAFKNYEDPGHYFYLNYFQDVSGGLLLWHSYPPEEFKVLLYYPETDTFVSSNVLKRYALTSTYQASIRNGTIHLTRNYDYLRLVLITTIRILIGIVLTCAIAFFIGNPRKRDYKYIIIPTVFFQILIHTLISIYSFKNGFSHVEYIGIMWLPYLLIFLLQGYLYSNHARTIRIPYICSFISHLVTYGCGLLLVDVIPSLFTIL